MYAPVKPYGPSYTSAGPAPPSPSSPADTSPSSETTPWGHHTSLCRVPNHFPFLSSSSYHSGLQSLYDFNFRVHSPLSSSHDCRYAKRPISKHLAVQPSKFEHKYTNFYRTSIISVRFLTYIPLPFTSQLSPWFFFFTNIANYRLISKSNPQ